MKPTRIQIRKILYATDLSETAVHAFSYAISLANQYGAGITILHVFAEFPGEAYITNMIPPSTWKAIKEHYYSKARDALIDRKRELVALKEVLQAFSEEAKNSSKDQAFATDEILIKTGAPAETIVQTAKEQDCDLVVMGTYGQGAITRSLIGSTAKWVVQHCPVPVLVIRLP